MSSGRDWTWGASDAPFTSVAYQKVVKSIEDCVKANGALLIQGKAHAFSKLLVSELVQRHKLVPQEKESGDS